MPHPERKILLNPGPATTTQTVKEALVVSDICPREDEFCQVLERIRTDLVRVVHGEEDYTAVLFAASGTGGVEAAITSAVPAGKKLLVIENGAYGTRMKAIAEAFGIEVVAYTLPYGNFPDMAVVETLLQTHPDISHVAVVHHETTTGMQNPVQAVCDLAHSYGAAVIVDGMSSYAGIPIDLRQWQAEYLISSSNKCIQGMAGLAFVIFQKRLLPQLQTQKRSYYFNLYQQHTGLEKTGQMPFTPPVQVVYALRQALNEYFTEGEQTRWNRYRHNWQLLYDGLSQLGFSFLLPPEQQSQILLAVCEPDWPGYSFASMHDFLYQRGVTIYPGKGARENTFRLSILGDLHPPDILHFIELLKAYVTLVGMNRIRPVSEPNP